MKMYRKTNVQPMEPWAENLAMNGVSVSEEDRANGSPQTGDMIAHDAKNPDDKWLVAAAFMAENYEEVPE